MSKKDLLPALGFCFAERKFRIKIVFKHIASILSLTFPRLTSSSGSTTGFKGKLVLGLYFLKGQIQNYTLFLLNSWTNEDERFLWGENQLFCFPQSTTIESNQTAKELLMKQNNIQKSCFFLSGSVNFCIIIKYRDDNTLERFLWIIKQIFFKMPLLQKPFLCTLCQIARSELNLREYTVARAIYILLYIHIYAIYILFAAQQGCKWMCLIESFRGAAGNNHIYDLKTDNYIFQMF